MNLVEKARQIATDAHSGQFRRDGKTPYVTHPEAVAAKLRENGESEEIIATGLLHDVLEDSEFTYLDLIDHKIPSSVIKAVIALTKTDDYNFYISRVKQNEIARKVKIQDILHNLSSNPKKKNIEKYLKALAYLFD